MLLFDFAKKSFLSQISSQSWLVENGMENYGESKFKKTFRVSRKTFQNIFQPIRRRLAKETINEEPVSPEERLAVCLYRLARRDYYHTISQLSGLGIATVCNIVTEVSQAIVESLWTEHVTKHFPKSEKMFIDKMVDTEEFWQFPVVGQRLMVATFRLSAHLVGSSLAKNIAISKNFIRWC